MTTMAACNNGATETTETTETTGAERREATVRVPASIIKTAAKQNSRYAVRGAMLRKIGKQVVAVATDGIAIASVKCEWSGEWPDAVIDNGTPVSNVLIPSDAIMRAKVKGFAEIIVAGDGVYAVLDMAGFGRQRVKVELNDGLFPPYEDVIPTDPENRRWIGVNAAFLKAVADSIVDADVSSDGKSVTIGIHKDPRKPIAVIGRSGLGVLMPVAVGLGPGGIPDWDDAVKKYAKAGEDD